MTFGLLIMLIWLGSVAAYLLWQFLSGSLESDRRVSASQMRLRSATLPVRIATHTRAEVTQRGASRRGMSR